MSEGKENEDSGNLKQIQRILQSQWKGRLKKSEEKVKQIEEPTSAPAQLDTKRIILRESPLEETARNSTSYKTFYDLDDTVVTKLRKKNGIETFCEQVQKCLRGSGIVPELIRDSERKLTNPIGCALVEKEEAVNSARKRKGNVVCGVCGNIKFYKDINKQKKFGTFACDSCLTFLLENISSRATSKFLCLTEKGLCLILPKDTDQKQANSSVAESCKACWLLLCLLGCDVGNKLFIKLKNILPDKLSANFTKNTNIEFLFGRILECTR